MNHIPYVCKLYPYRDRNTFLWNSYSDSPDEMMIDLLLLSVS